MADFVHIFCHGSSSSPQVVFVLLAQQKLTPKDTTAQILNPDFLFVQSGFKINEAFSLENSYIRVQNLLISVFGSSVFHKSFVMVFVLLAQQKLTPKDNIAQILNPDFLFVQSGFMINEAFSLKNLDQSDFTNQQIS